MSRTNTLSVKLIIALALVAATAVIPARADDASAAAQNGKADPVTDTTAQPASAEGQGGAADPLTTGDFHWRLSPPLVSPAKRSEDPCHAIKDPTVVFADGKWHLFCTVRSRTRTHQIEYLSFADWADADKAPRRVMKVSDGYYCAPQVFYFRPQKKWYLICQASNDAWTPKYQSAFATTETLGDVNSWTKLQPLGMQPAEEKKMGLDFWIICDDTRAWLFFTTLDGRMWREHTTLDQFPHGWSKPELALKADIFEAAHIYRLRGRPQYLALIEAQGPGGRRYYKAYTADRLDAEWHPLADSWQKPFAAVGNVDVGDKGDARWTDAVSHGELLRAGVDERLEVDPADLRFLIQGTSDADRAGKPYGDIPWRLGILMPVR